MLRWRRVVRRVSDGLGYERVDGKAGWHSEGVFWGEVRILLMGEVQLNWYYESRLCAIAKAIS